MTRSRILFTAACLAGMLLFSGLCSGTVPCLVVVPNVAHVHGVSFTLADLLSPQTCPEFATAATRLALGRVPLEGSTRVLERNELRGRIEEFARQQHQDFSLVFDLPETIRVRRAGIRSSCAEISAKLLGPVPEAGPSPWRETDCGAAGRVRRDAAFRILRKNWDPALGSWILSVGCADPADCVPFVLRVPDAASGNVTALPSLTVKAAVPVMRAGQTASLLWEQNGIRLLLPVVCMESGSVGDRVQVRVKNGRRVLRALVLRAGMLRAIS